MDAWEGWPILAEVVRSGLVESRHRGRLVALDSSGGIAWAIGDVSEPILPRSTAKPLQAVGMLRAGMQLDGTELALVSASHSGEPIHVFGVRQILSDIGLSESALLCPPAWPLDDEEKRAHLAEGGEATAVHMNCSGKHAGMLATCVARGWPTDSYLDPTHPLQRTIRDTIEEYTGEPVTAVGVDGCGAPLFAFSLTALARAYHWLALAPIGSNERRVVDAIRQHPHWVSGTRRDEAELISQVPGLFAKGGAEGCYAVGLADGWTVALKIEDGSQRARPVVMAEALRRLGVDAPVLVEQSTSPVLGGGRQVGELRACLDATTSVSAPFQV